MSKKIKDQKKINEVAMNMAAYKDKYIEDLFALLAIPSVRAEATARAPYGEGTADALDKFIEIAERMGFRTKNLDYHVGYAEFGEGDQMIGVLCHLDVVPADEGWAHDPFKPRMEDNVIFARGVADDKGPAMAVLYAMKALKDDGYVPPCRIRLIVGLNEESGFGCINHYHQVKEEIPVAGFTADARFPGVFAEKGIVHATYRMARTLKGEGLELYSLTGGEAANMVPQTAQYFLQKDCVKSAKFIVEGKSSHASRPNLGENAIVKALHEIIAQNPDWQDPLRDLTEQYFNEHINGKDFGIDCRDESGELTLNLGVIEVTPETAAITFDIRYPVSQDGNDLIRKLSDRLAVFGFSCDDCSIVPPLDLGKNSLLMNTVMNVYNQAMGTSDEAVAMGGGTYAKEMPNITAFGAVFPGTPDCMHQVDEHAIIDDLLAASYIYKETLRALAENQR